MKLAVFTLSLLSLTVLFSNLPHGDGCSMPVGWKAPTVVQKLRFYSDVIMGTVRRQIQEPGRYPYSSVYSAEVEIHCILRGERKPVLFNVTWAGYMPGLCSAATLEKDKMYIIGLYEETRAGAPTISAADFPEALSACNLNRPTYPLGLSEATASFVCPAGKPPGQCKTE